MGDGETRAFRSDIQGLRAVAVVLVLVGHIFAWPTGGYIGVDVFFVISGFLITGILLRQEQTSGRISIASFYGQRARRILPAAMFVLVVVVAAGFAVWRLPQAMQTAVDAFASATFVMNWHLVVLGTDYLQASGPPSPLQHYWSLAVEEQFYLLWPVLLALVLLGIRRAGLTGRARLTALLVVVGLLCVLSLGYAAWRMQDDPAAAYFDSIGRAWQLGAGALLAILNTSPVRRNAGRAAPAVALVGLVAVFAAALLLTPRSAFPFPWALVPVIGTALVIWAGATSGVAHTLLSNRVALFLGNISYSLYLWHWPVAALADTVLGHGLRSQLTTVVLSVLLAWATLLWIETPFRRKRFPSAPLRVDVLIGGAVTVVILSMTALQFQGPAWVRNGTSALESVWPSTLVTLDGPAPDQAELARLVAASVDATHWPADVQPGLDRITQEQRPSPMRECLNRPHVVKEPKVCSAGPHDAPRTALLLGDSVSVAWAPALEDALVPQGWQVRTLGFSSCPVVAPDRAWALEGFSEPCQRWREEMYREAAASEPDLIVVSHAEAYVPEELTAAQREGWTQATTTMVDRLSADGSHVVLLGPPARALHPPDCLSRVRGPEVCTSQLMARTDAYAEIEGAVAAESGGRASYVDTRPWLCTPDGRCPAFIGTTFLRTDNTHLTHRGSQLLSGALAEELAPYTAP